VRDTLAPTQIADSSVEQFLARMSGDASFGVGSTGSIVNAAARIDRPNSNFVSTVPPTRQSTANELPGQRMTTIGCHQ